MYNHNVNYFDMFLEKKTKRHENMLLINI